MFTFNIANGLTAGLALYPIMKVLAGRARELRPATLVLAALCGLYYTFGLPHELAVSSQLSGETGRAGGRPPKS